ncbi:MULTISPECIES: hypothetical protein [Geobacillus]|uniref:hypothetical protein n=1 Tax=Geobacillus TaxID=129337 RepID=UPI0009BE7829|nr:MULTISPECIES: hypothetical protein [Geobacillus]OQP07579.1 hypothetical protein B1690_03350 [Geobacillus sp. 46C-IIa]OQP08283.1 hypothetical protein B1692_17935 [Geobacillus thermoleovorans]OQP16186.1 hypothetical protein B1693_09835 [Geobacillus zalihae]QNU28261.1 hypothetical protein IC803_01385 [Geobacillus sp. 46C-IIa]
MGSLYRYVQKTGMEKEMKRRNVIQRLRKMGINEFKGQQIDEFDFEELKWILAVEQAKRDE